MESVCFMDEGNVLVCLSMKVPCFMDGRGSGRGLSMESVCFMDGGNVLVCLSMKVPCFMDKLLSGEWGWVLLGNL